MDYRLVKHGPETTKARYEIYIKWITVDGDRYMKDMKARILSRFAL